MDAAATVYGEEWAGVYDDWLAWHDEAEPAPLIDLLASLARGGPALELGVGTGRFALPLVRRGIAVRGIEASPAMVQRLRAKPDGDRVRVFLGDMADVAVLGRFPLIFCVTNTLFCLPDAQAQARCFRNAALHLVDDGLFVVEGVVMARGWTTHAEDRDAAGVHIHTDTQHDEAAQVITTDTTLTRDGEVHRLSARYRYAWPDELDTFAAAAGLRLRDRRGDWGVGPFTADTRRHVSIYERA